MVVERRGVCCWVYVDVLEFLLPVLLVVVVWNVRNSDDGNEGLKVECEGKER